MIIRKPYAFLIKHFRKIHIILLALALFIYYKNTQVYTFLKEFIALGTYDYYNEPISGYIGFTTTLGLLILIIGSTLLALLLRHKEKPWKLYLLPIIQYVILFIAYLFVNSFFASYTGSEATTSMRVWRDIMFMSYFVQFIVFAIFIIRILGVDLKKFNFKLDEEYLELEQGDKEEFEININIDKHSFKRIYNRVIRNLKYVYFEHRLLCNSIIVILALLTIKNTYFYIASHKSYKEGDNFTINDYEIKINNSYYTDKSYNGEVISKKSNYVVIDISIKNIGKERTVDLNKYHLMNGISNYTATEKTFEKEFQDLGKTYDSLTLKNGKSARLLLIYKVDKNLSKDRFVLYYQELGYNTSYLRKIKLQITDLSKIKKEKELSIGDTMTFTNGNNEENITLDSVEISQGADYVYKSCSYNDCEPKRVTYVAPEGYQVMKISFGSDTFEGQYMNEFTKEYAKIKYKDTNNKVKAISVTNPIRRGYDGKYIYIQIPNEVVSSNDIKLVYTIRNKEYSYKIERE